MKIGKLICNEWGNPVKTGQKSYKYFHLVLETLDDVFRYQSFYEPLTAEKNISLLFGYKSQNFRKSFGDYLIHEGVNVAPESRLLAIRLDYKETPTDILEFCNMSDNIMNNKINNIIKFINQNKIVRLNSKGGYCYMSQDEYANYYSELTEPTDKQIANFITSGNFFLDDLIITSHTVIIENSRTLNPDFLTLLNKNRINTNEANILNNFKTRITGFKDDEILKIFQSGISELENICFETTGQDYHNIYKLKTLLDYLLKINPDKKLNIWIKTYNKQVKELFKTTEQLDIKFL